MADCARRISAVIIAFNEEADIERALESVAWCDEILVVDSSSTDRTVEICNAHGCKVLHREFAGYGDQKAFAVTRAAHDWILSVDADEEVSPALRDEILSKFKQGSDSHGYYLPVTTVLWDHVIRTARRHTKPKLRLFDRRFGNFGKQLVHESVSLLGPAEYLTQPMYNHSFADFADYFEKFNRYTSLGARECLGRGNRAGFLRTIFRLPVTFLQIYIVKGFILDGAVGLTWSLFASLYTAVKHLKLLELCRAEDRQKLEQESNLSARRMETLTGEIPGTAFFERESDWKAALRKVLSERGTNYFFAACSVILAWILMGQFGRNEPGYYSLLTLASISVSARFWGFGPSLAATALGLVGLDYFAIQPTGFSLPDPQELGQLALFAVLALLSSFLIYASRRKSLP